MDTETPYQPQIVIDRSAAAPLHAQISQPLAELITSGELPPGSLIEDEVSLAARLKVSRPTARHALQDLVTRGLLTRRRGSGTRVTPARVHRTAGLTSLKADLEAAGHTTHTDVLSYHMQLADSQAAALLECPEGTEIVRVERLRWSNGQPLAIMSNLLPADVAPSLTELSNNGLYACLEAAGVRLTNASEVIGARSADSEAATLLRLPSGAALLTLARTSYDETGKVIEYGNHAYDAERYSLQLASTLD